jgi:hypothetical protein
VDLLRAADETHRREAVTPAVERLAGRGDELGVVGQPKVIVGAKVQDLLPAGDGDVGRLVGSDDALALVEAGGLDLGEGLGQVGGVGGIH